MFHVFSLVCFLIHGVKRRQVLIAKPRFYFYFSDFTLFIFSLTIFMFFTSRPHACGESGVCVYRFWRWAVPFLLEVTFGALKATLTKSRSPIPGKSAKIIVKTSIWEPRNSEADPPSGSGASGRTQNATSGAEPTLGSPRRGSGLR